MSLNKILMKPFFHPPSIKKPAIKIILIKFMSNSVNKKFLLPYGAEASLESSSKKFSKARSKAL